MPLKRNQNQDAGAVEAVEDEVSVETVGRIFQRVHRSAAHAQKCKKDLFLLAEKDLKGTVSAVTAVELLILKQTPQLTSDTLKRHYAFLTDVCRAFKEHGYSDELSVSVLQQLLAFHNANDKQVRLAIVTTYETLLKTVDQSNTSEERQDFYQAVAEALKQRVHDRCPHVREKAAAAVAAFQTGRKNCDVSQQLLALLCTDSNADVRRQVLRSIAPRKEFLEGYFPSMIRCTRDVVARVRVEAWDALGRFAWRYITAYASAKGVRLPELISQGLADHSNSVVIACRAALCNCWLHRDCRDECETLLDGVACGYVLPSLLPFERISNEMLAYVQKRTPQRHFPLNLEDLNTSSLLMWKADCKATSDREGEGEDETELLLPLPRFAAVLQDAVYAYARPDAAPKTVKFRSVEDADNMLRVLLAVFDVYEDNGYLAHTDNTTRVSLLRLFSFLLKVVPDDDPALFVDVAVRSLKSLTRRTPEEATKIVTSALDSLFRSLKLPQRYALGFEDIEALARKSRERQQELARRMARLRGGDASQDEVDELKAEMDRDEKFLLRMQLIVLSFLSHSERGDAIAAFCSHVIQLGRQLDNEKVKTAAIRSLGLQCLVSAETVHTFMPPILADAVEPVDGDGRGTDDATASVPVVAAGVVFDLVMEYGFRFFDVHGRAGSSARSLDVANNDHLHHEDGGAVLANAGERGDAKEARLLREQELAEEDVHKVGSRSLFLTLLSFLHPQGRGGAQTTVALTGFCKLLSCNRVASESVPRLTAALLCHFARLQYAKKEAAGSVTGYLYDYLDKFFHSYAASHPVRQAFLAKGGVAAFWALLHRNTAVAARLMDYVLRITDPFTLTQIRDIDPVIAKRVSGGSGGGGEPDALSETGEAGGRAATRAEASSRAAAAQSSMHSGRLLRELSRFSLHERIAEDILMEFTRTAEETTVEQKLVCIETLERRMYFYSKDPQPLLVRCANKALEALSTQKRDDGGGEWEPLHRRLQAWLDDVMSRQGGLFWPSSPNSVAPFTVGRECETRDENLLETIATRSSDHAALLSYLAESGFFNLDGIPQQTARRAANTAASLVKKREEEEKSDRGATVRKHERSDSVFLDVGAAAGTRRRPRI